ncbi:MAG: large subunit ribosomal protein L15 [archaeon GW2011_AR19]|nr:large subunit ribosomal protein L15 [uncultured archaeon]KHO55517.1 MAG: large subunit ribosomal protein L15 [archaeon GW2011_AR19]
MSIKTKKRKKSSRYHGRKRGTCGTGARKKMKGSGHRGGKGMAGTGKRADQKKTLILKLYGHDYFGKQGITSKKTERDKRKRINLDSIYKNLESFGKRKGDAYEINLNSYKILAGQLEIKKKLIITAQSSSGSAIEKVEKAGGKIILPEKKVGEKKEKEEK